MPTYPYLCSGCQYEWEIEQSIRDEPIDCCPECGGNKVKRQIVSGNFVLKGGGWYKDGYGSTSTQSPGTSTAAKPREG